MASEIFKELRLSIERIAAAKRPYTAKLQEVPAEIENEHVRLVTEYGRAWEAAGRTGPAPVWPYPEND